LSRCSKYKIVDVIAALVDYGIVITIFDPLRNPDAVKHGIITNYSKVPNANFDAIVLGVAHNEF
jgi:UDP-N-acetyl-D-galactosamine dehydrogenase